MKWLYDPDGNLIGGPTTEGTIKAAGPLGQTRPIGVYVTNPLAMNSQMKFSMGGRSLWDSYTNKPGGLGFCQQVAMEPWIQNTVAKAGQREFSCYVEGTA